MSGMCPRAERAIQYRRSAKSDDCTSFRAPREQSTQLADKVETYASSAS
jgi:hypothetical protein